MDRTELRRVSKALLGNAYLLEASVVIARLGEGTFYTREIARRLAIADSVVAPVLKRLEAGGLLKRLPRTAAHQEFERMPSVYWHLSHQLMAELTDGSFAL